MDQDTLTHISSRIYEIVNLVSHSVLGVKQNLVFLVQPIEGQISNANSFPHVFDLSARTVDYVSDFVGNYEF